MARPSVRRGFTLVELLVVIAIIGILIALLLPAVQAAREAARRVQCTNNLKQLALAFHIHHDQQKAFPTGGWGYAWVCDPDRGFGKKQPGGWGYVSLPFIEQQALFDLGKGGSDAQRKTANKQRIETPLSHLHCPTRRRAKLYPVVPGIDFVVQPRFSDRLTVAARNDYAANGGEVAGDGFVEGPKTLAEGDTTFQWTEMSVATGVVANGGEFRVGDISDGTSNTYCIGEKYCDPDDYETGLDYGDDQTVYSGDERDIIRFARDLLPKQDQPGYEYNWAFGSAHSAVMNMGFCDSSVRSISYAIDKDVHRWLANRADGNAVSAP